MRRKSPVFLRVFLCALLIFTVYVLLDTFVIVRRLEPAAEPQTSSAQTAGAEETTAADTPIVTQLSVPAQEKSGAGTVTTENS